MTTLLQPPQQAVLREVTASVAHLPGDLAELGVYRGGSAKLIHECLRGRRLHLFDTFTGLPDPDPAHGDTHPKGRFRAEASEVLSALRGVPLTLYVGHFPESLSDMTLPPLAFAHIDADLYWSVKAALKVFWASLVPGGVILVDDYGWDDCLGARQAVDEFGGAVIMPSGQAVLRRAA